MSCCARTSSFPPSLVRHSRLSFQPVLIHSRPLQDYGQQRSPIQPHAARCFSATPRPQTRARRAMFKWLTGPGKVFLRPRKDSTNYLSAYDASGNLIREAEGAAQAEREREEAQEASGDNGSRDDNRGAREYAAGKGEGAEKGKYRLPKESQDDLKVFPQNPTFWSEAVLSERLKHEVYMRVVKKGQSIREVSVALHIDMRRVAAVVRLKTVEQEWQKQGKPIYQFYQDAVLNMLPQTNYNPRSDRNPRHESVNDLPVHPATLRQVFHPTSESRQFTRVDAGRVFSEHLLPADERIPHPELIQEARDQRELGPSAAAKQLRMRIAEIEKERTRQLEKRKRLEEEKITVVAGNRWDFKFRDISVEAAGRDGRGRKGVGARYGLPHEDRKKGQVKIPTSVE